MKFLITGAIVVATVFTFNCTASADIVASYDTWGNGSSAPDFTNNFSVALSGDAVRDTRTNNGSTDGTYGTLAANGGAPAPSTTVGQFRVEKTGIFGVDPVPHLATSRTLTASITNNSGVAMELDGVYFDLNGNNGAYNTWSVEQGGTVLGSGGGLLTGYQNADNPFAGIPIANGATVALDIVFTGATNGNPSALLDNLAFTASVPATVPEPSSLALLALAGLGFVRRRRK